MSSFRTPDRFPGLERLGPDGRRFVHADAAGGSLVPETVGTAVAAALLHANCNPNRPHPLSVEVAQLTSEAREEFGRFAGAEAEGIVFGPSATALTWHFARTFADWVRPGDEIVCTRLDHEANVSPWLALAERRQARVRFVDLDYETWQPNLRTLEASVNDRTRLIAFTRASNLTGTIVDPGPFVEAAHAVGAITYADGVHLAAHLPLRQRELGIDVQVCSPYKFFGPHMGVLSARADLLEELEPDRVRPAPTRGPRRWEPGMPSVEAVAGLKAAL